LARTVLLADDSVTAQNMGRRILMDAGYEVITVNNGSAALKKIHEHRPDLIVLDVYMPGYGGLEVCQRLKESPDTARIPVLLSVGKMEPFKADEAKRVRADGHIVKPFEASELLAALTKLEDRIVPADSREGRWGKVEKKGRTWQTEDTVIGIEAARTDRVAHLSEAKKRQASSGSGEAEPQDVVQHKNKEVAQDVVAQEKDKQEAALAATDQPTAENVPSNSSEAQTPAPAAEVAAGEARTGEPPAVADGNSQEWVLGKSLFGKPVHGEIGLGESIFDKTIFGKSAPGKSASGKLGPEKSAPSELAFDAPAEATAPLEAATVAIAPADEPRWIAENVPLTAEEASMDLDAEMQRSRAITAAVAIASESTPQEQVASSNAALEQTAPQAIAELETASSTEAAFAAAASAGASSGVPGLSGQRSASGTQPAQEDSEATVETTVASEVEPPVPSEATAAWENWQQIRDSVMSPKKAEALAESVAEMATASTQSAAPASSPESGSESAASQGPTASVIAAAAAEEASSINDIVDSVLADMKPRLMAEIAKKLAAKK
jgi:CheY-like chemotaxis protein